MESRLVYSTDPIKNRPCPKCGRRIFECICPPDPVVPMGGETVILRIEKKGRAGKTVTVLTGFTRHASELDDLARRMKRAFGAGGTRKDRAIEIQGDVRGPVREFLEREGFRVKGG